MRREGTPTRLYGDDELAVLWLVRGRAELALSSEGVWARSGRQGEELEWKELAQVQGVPATRAGTTVLVQLFLDDGRARSIGPFARAEAARWLAACRQAAVEHGERALPLDGADGFALAR